MHLIGQPSRGGRIGVISDTHGLLRPEALEALEGVDRILHAGDIGDPDHLGALARIAPVTAVRGNIDRGHWAEALPETVSLMVGGLRIHMIHDRKALQADPEALAPRSTRCPSDLLPPRHGRSNRPTVCFGYGVKKADRSTDVFDFASRPFCYRENNVSIG
ncbi:metallophosphoesterase family protein [Paracoccus jeotgali]|uniref:Calcineurin-like phosphoesterase domain-containing protein n=1 Tax=Paracoccus jeotgali TaxID=2065379 RepID=A0A2K9MBS8_9RHOB|nr:metallophosphoesterase family protein [Paracoccus jeotgali]AUM73084.1 hypothetical protein CYR75_01135 [Paracoccus jeotgali]